MIIFNTYQSDYHKNHFLTIKEDQILLIFVVVVMISVFIIIKAASLVTKKNFRKNYDNDGSYPKSEYISLGPFVSIVSHHEDEFKLHEMAIGSKMVCTGCFGAIIGFIIGIISFSIYYFFDPSFNNVYYKVTIIIFSATMVLLSCTKYIAEYVGFSRLIRNILFPIGFWFYIIAIINVYASFILIVIFPILSLTFRLHLTKLSHS